MVDYNSKIAVIVLLIDSALIDTYRYESYNGFL